MNRKSLIVMVLSLLLSASILVTTGLAQVTNPSELVIGTIGEPATVDPADCYDTASLELIMNVYDTLIFFDGEHVDEFIPLVATEWDLEVVEMSVESTTAVDLSAPESTQWVDTAGNEYHLKTWTEKYPNEVLDNEDDFVELESKPPAEPCIRNWRVEAVTVAGDTVTLDLKRWRWWFKIREGVKFHNGADLTCEDVEYSFERMMVMEAVTGGCSWMIFEPLLHTFGPDLDDPDQFMLKMCCTVECGEGNVYFNLWGPYPAMVFQQIIAQAWSSILNKEWAIAQGCWDGVCSGESLLEYNLPALDPLMDPEPVMMGTGPYIFDYWDTGLEWSIYRFEGYWGGWPSAHPVFGSCRGYVDRVTEKFITEWPTRKLQFLAGDLDFCYVPREYMYDVWGQPGILCAYPLSGVTSGGQFYNYNVSLASRYLRSPFTSYECTYGELNEGGFPPDFFSDIHVRKAFSYIVDYIEFQEVAFLGESQYPASPHVYGIPYRRSDEWYAEHQYMQDLEKAEEEFKLAWGGELWETGFTLTIQYNAGNVARKTLAEMIATGVENLNAKFHCPLLDIEWGTVYIPELFRGQLALFIIGWIEDYHDPHNWFHPYMHSEGTFSEPQAFSDPYVDALIEEGIQITDEARRQEIYYELQELYFEHCPGVCVYQPTGRHWERDWVQGWYYNPILGGGYFAYYWKEDLPREDTNDDGLANIKDLFLVAKAFGSYYVVGDVHPRWNSYADLNQDTLVNIKDIFQIAKIFGYKHPDWTPT